MLTLGAGVPLNGLVDFSMHAGAKRGRLQKAAPHAPRARFNVANSKPLTTLQAIKDVLPTLLALPHLDGYFEGFATATNLDDGTIEFLDLRVMEHFEFRLSGGDIVHGLAKMQDADWAELHEMPRAPKEFIWAARCCKQGKRQVLWDRGPMPRVILTSNYDVAQKYVGDAVTFLRGCARFRPQPRTVQDMALMSAEFTLMYWAKARVDGVDGPLDIVEACKEHNLSVQDLLSGWTHDAIRFAVERVGKRFTPALTLAPSLAFIDDDANVTSGKKGKRVGVKAKAPVAKRPSCGAQAGKVYNEINPSWLAAQAAAAAAESGDKSNSAAAAAQPVWYGHAQHEAALPGPAPFDPNHHHKARGRGAGKDDDVQDKAPLGRASPQQHMGAQVPEQRNAPAMASEAIEAALAAAQALADENAGCADFIVRALARGYTAHTFARAAANQAAA